jgi:iron complex outermembrane receptor protein
MPRSLLFVVFFVLLPLPLWGEQIDNKAEDTFALFFEEQIVITPAKHPQKISQSPFAVTVITQEEIRQSGATNIADLLRRVPGIEIMKMNPATFNVSIRGNNQILSNKLLVMIDGRTTYGQIQNSTPWATLPIALDEIARIEIIRGPGSAAWGSNAFDGVINIITEAASAHQGNSASVAIGEENTRIVNLIHSGGEGPFAYRLSFGYDRFGSEETRALSLEAIHANARFEYRALGGERLSLSVGENNAPRYDGPIWDGARPDAHIREHYLQLRYETSTSHLQFYRNDYNSEGRPNLYVPLTFPDFHFLATTYHVEGQRVTKIGASHQFLSGIETRIADVKGYLDRRHHVHRHSLILQDEWAPTDRNTLTYGGRYDHHHVRRFGLCRVGKTP